MCRMQRKNSFLESLTSSSQVNLNVDLIWFDLIWFDLIWFDLIWFDLIWFVSFVSFVSFRLTVQAHSGIGDFSQAFRVLSAPYSHSVLIISFLFLIHLLSIIEILGFQGASSTSLILTLNSCAFINFFRDFFRGFKKKEFF